MTIEEKRQDKINKAIKDLEEQIGETRTEIWVTEDENFCPYKITDLIIRLNKSIEYLEIIKSLK